MSAETEVRLPEFAAVRKNGKMCRVRPDLACNHRLTGREYDVLAGIMAGDSSDESACQLNKRPQLIEDYRERIKQKIGANSLDEVIQIMMTKSCSSFARQHLRRSSSI
jgi:DNA-binding CsgD family transcriptional regulator